MANRWVRIKTTRAKVVTTVAVVSVAVGAAAVHNSFNSPDTSPPVVRITDPASGATVSGTETLTATCKDASNCNGVTFSVNGVSIGAADLTPPSTFTLDWDSTGTDDGSVSLTATGTDGSGNTTTSIAKTVDVGNHFANLWIDTNGGTCTRNSSPAAYSNPAACGTFQAAYDAMHDGDTIVVKNGSYGGISITKNGHDQTGPVTSFRCESNLGCVLGYLFLGIFNNELGPSYLSFDGFDMASFSDQGDCHGLGQPECSHTPGTTATDITLQNSWIHSWNRCNTGGSCPLIGCCAANFTVRNNQIGPACCSGDAVETGAGDNFTFTGNYVHDIYDSCTVRGMNRYGSACQGTGFADDSNGGYDHVDGMQLQGGTDLVITDNRFYNAGLQGIFLENAFGIGYDNVTVANNMVGAVCNGGCGQAVTFGSNAAGGISGTLVYAYNTVDGLLSMGGGGGGQDFADDATVVWVGNIATTACTKIGTTGCSPCTLGTPDGTISPTFSHNEFVNTTCGDSHSIMGAATFVNTNPLTPDLRLSGPQAAIDAGETTYCGTGKLVGTDLFGTARPVGSACDIGAYEVP